MIARSAAVIAAGGRLRSLRCAPPLTLRQVLTDEAETCALCLVGTAAGPLPGDDLELSLRVEEGARATLRATGASIAQGRGDEESGRLRIGAVLERGASLEAEPGALIVCAGSRVETRIEIDLAEDASIRWRELIVLGRTGDSPGSACLSWRVDRGGYPLLRQRIELSDPLLTSWPGMLGGARVLASTLLAGPTVDARTVVRSPRAVAQRLADGALLITVLADDAASAGAELDALLGALPQDNGVFRPDSEPKTPRSAADQANGASTTAISSAAVVAS